MDVFQFTSSTPPFSVVPAGGFSWDWDIISSRLFDDDDFMKSIAAWVTPFCRDLILPCKFRKCIPTYVFVLNQKSF